MNPKVVRKARELLPEGEIYCDWAASALALPPSSPTFIPPHHAGSETLDKARAAVRKFLSDTEEKYHIVFTAGTTASFQLLAHRIPWSEADAFICHNHVHNSVLGIRNVAVHAGAEFHSLPTSAFVYGECSTSQYQKKQGIAVFAFPGECNLTGSVYPMSFAKNAKSDGMLGYPTGKVITIVDTAKLIANSQISLDELPYVDALVLSLYKLSSTYTGLGVLLVRKNTLLEQLLHSSGTRSYFGGQSSEAITPFSTALHVPSPSLERALSSGTPNLQAIHALPEQLAHFENMSDIYGHICSIGRTFRANLLEAFPRIIVYSDEFTVSNPGTTSFTLFRAGTPIGHHEIATILSLNGVHVRAGTMCNISATAHMLDLSDEDIIELHRRGYRCGEGADLVSGRATGVVRVSFGWGSSAEDAKKVVQVLQDFVGTGINRPLRGKGNRCVKKLVVYPVKGCRGVEVDTSACVGGGLKGDRMFAVIDKCTEKVLDVKCCPELRNIEASYLVDVDGDMLVMRESSTELHLNIRQIEAVTRANKQFDGEGTCGAIGKLAAELKDSCAELFLSRALKRPAILAILHGHKRDALVVTEKEVSEIANANACSTDIIMRAVRPNVVLSGGGVSADFITLTGSVVLTHIRKCTRCTTVNINAGIGKSQPLLSIARMCRRHGGGLVLGAVMRVSQGFLHVGDVIKCMS